MSKSYTPPDRSTYDPGWNDPPPMPVASVDGTVNKPAKTKLNLNKRIAFPMAGIGGSPSSSSNVKTTAEGLPLPFSTAKYQTPPTVFQPTLSASEPATLSLPPSAAAPSPNVSSASSPIESSPVASATQVTAEDSIDLSTARIFCQSIFDRLSHVMASKIDVGRMAEIRKRLDILNGMWLEKKLNRSTQIDLYNIAKALDDNDVESAKEQHRQLTVNHINACHQWGTALRQLILSLDETHGEQSNQDGPAVLPENEFNVVQLLNVSSTAHVVDGTAIPFAINPIDPIAPLESNVSAHLPPSSNKNVNNNEDSGLPQIADRERRTSKSRFGRIIHI